MAPLEVCWDFTVLCSKNLMQALTLILVDYVCYFTSFRPKVNTSSVSGTFGRHPLLAPCLKGLGKFSHLIDLDFMSDIMTVLKKLASNNGDAVSSESSLTVSERLQCCIVAFKVMRNNLDALNVDLHEFFVQLYNLLLECRPDRLAMNSIEMSMLYSNYLPGMCEMLFSFL